MRHSAYWVGPYRALLGLTAHPTSPPLIQQKKLFLKGLTMLNIDQNGK